MMDPYPTDGRSPSTAAVSRRSVAKGLAWAAPAVAAVTTSPAFAASPSENANITFRHARFHSRDARYSRTHQPFFISTVRTVHGGRPDTRDIVGMRWFGTSPETSITNVSTTYWYPFPDMRWSNWGYHDSCWTLPTRDSQKDTYHNGNRMYAYSLRYVCPITSTGSEVTLKPFDVQSNSVYVTPVRHTSANVYGLAYYFTLNGIDYVYGAGTSTGVPSWSTLTPMYR